MKNQTITVKEKAVLFSTAWSQYQICDGNDKDVINAQMYQWDVVDCAKGVSSKSFPGVVSSLTKKGLVTSDSTLGKNNNLIALTEEGFKALHQ